MHHDGAGSPLRAASAIVATPPVLAGRIDYRPRLGGLREQLTQNVPMGSVIKTMTMYERPWWRDDGLSGQAAAWAGRSAVVFDNSPTDASCGILLGFIEGKASHEARKLAPERAAPGRGS